MPNIFRGSTLLWLLFFVESLIEDGGKSICYRNVILIIIHEVTVAFLSFFNSIQKLVIDDEVSAAWGRLTSDSSTVSWIACGYPEGSSNQMIVSSIYMYFCMIGFDAWGYKSWNPQIRPYISI